MSTMDHIWPSDLSRSLWNYDALQQPRNIPFMGYTFSNEFYLALIGGAAIIVMFALRRFNTHSVEIHSIDVRALQELKPMDLRGGELMWQAYFRYVGVLLVIFLALTLFGSLVIQAINQLPAVAGLQVDTKNVDFESPEWPLLIGLGIAGFVPMLKPVELFETRLRAWAHRSAGIPIRITQQTNKIKKALDNLTGPAPDYDQAPNWLDKIAPETEQKRAFKSRAQLRHLLDWAKDQRAYWPNAQARNVLKELEVEETMAAFLTLEAFDDLLIESYDRVAGVGQSSEVAEAAAGFRGQGLTGRDGRTLSYSAGPRDALLRHRRRLEREWNDLTARIDTSRDELASMLAIFVEHDDRTDQIANPELKTVVDEARGNAALEEGPTFWLYLSLIPVAVIYWVAIRNDQHSVLSNLERTEWAMVLSALVNTMKTAIQFCIPVSIVLGWRHMLRETGDNWVLINVLSLDRTMARQLLRACLIAGIAALILFALLGLLWAAIISRTDAQFRELYFVSQFGFAPILPYFATQFMISVVSAAITLVAVDFVQIYKPRSIWPLVPLGLLNAALVLVLWAAHIQTFLGFEFCDPNGTAFSVMKQMMLTDPFGACYGVYEGTDLYLYALLAFCSACYFIPPAADQSSSEGELAAAFKGLVARTKSAFVRTSAVVLIVAGSGSLAPQIAVAQDAQASQNVVRLGFRNDVQPFSYFDEGEQRYRGYLVDLCLRIFTGRTDLSGGFPNYDIETSQITVKDRFNSFKAAPGEPEIDVLCDPVTIAFQPYGTEGEDDTGRDGGVFSPIVFASGVSYLTRNLGPGDGHFILSWVEGVTAARVAYRACRSDLFKLRPKDADVCGEEIVTATNAPSKRYPKCADLKIGVQAGGSDAQVEDRKYFYCTFDSHKQAIEWFCSDELGVNRAYFGDRDIIVAKLDGKIGREGENSKDCSSVVRANETYTYEPYALVINKSRPDLIRFVQRRIYEIFSNRDEIAGIFSANFGGRKMTRTLANLFLLNAVEHKQ